MWIPISLTSWWMTSSKVSSEFSVTGVCLLTWIGKLIRFLSDCKSAWRQRKIYSVETTSHQVLHSYLHRHRLHWIGCTIVYANVTGKCFTQINVAKTLRQKHELSSWQCLGAIDCGYIVFQDFRKQIAWQISFFGCNNSGIDQGRSGKPHNLMVMKLE